MSNYMCHLAPMQLDALCEVADREDYEGEYIPSEEKVYATQWHNFDGTTPKHVTLVEKRKKLRALLDKRNAVL